MVNFELLKSTIENKGMTIKSFSDQEQIDAKKFEGIGEITASELYKICEALKLTKQERGEIFFAPEN